MTARRVALLVRAALTTAVPLSMTLRPLRPLAVRVTRILVRLLALLLTAATAATFATTTAAFAGRARSIAVLLMRGPTLTLRPTLPGL